MNFLNSNLEQYTDSEINDIFCDLPKELKIEVLEDAGLELPSKNWRRDEE